MANGDVQRNYTPNNKIIFNIDNVDKFFIDHGLYTVWEKSFLCPCRNKETNAPSSVCPRCHGVGFAHTNAVGTITLLQSQDKNVMNKADVGLSLAGSAIATVPKEDFVTYRDRLSFPDNLVPQSMLVLVTKDMVKAGAYLRYEVIDVLYACDDSDKEYKPKDIKIVNNFFYPTEDMVGKYISLNLLVTLRYYVVNVLRESRYQYQMGSDPRKPKFQRKFVNLPRKLLLRREDMFNPDIISGNGEAIMDESSNLSTGIEKGFEGFFD